MGKDSRSWYEGYNFFNRDVFKYLLLPLTYKHMYFIFDRLYIRHLVSKHNCTRPELFTYAKQQCLNVFKSWNKTKLLLAIYPNLMFI